MKMRIINKSGYPLEYKTSGSIGLDLHAIIGSKRTIESGRRWIFPTGIFVEIPFGYGGFVQPRSGLARDHGIVCVTGVIDADYRGEIGVNLLNLGQQPYEVLPGDRIAQLTIGPVERVELEVVDELTDTQRGASGFGSTSR